MERKGIIIIAIILMQSVVFCSFGQQKQEGVKDFIEFKPIPVEGKKDGFYATLVFEQSSEAEGVKLENTPSLTSKDIKKVKRVISNYSNQPEILIKFTKNGAQRFQLLTKENIGKQIAIVIAEHIVSLPIVQSEIKGGSVVINGNFSLEEIDEMIAKLKGK